jgi:hypothetical protein
MPEASNNLGKRCANLRQTIAKRDFTAANRARAGVNRRSKSATRDRLKAALLSSVFKADCATLRRRSFSPKVAIWSRSDHRVFSKTCGSNVGHCPLESQRWATKLGARVFFAQFLAVRHAAVTARA